MTGPAGAPITRRRFVVLAAAAALGGSDRTACWEWRGAALGAEARIVLEGPRDSAEAAIAAVTAEIARLERLYSLHDPDAQLARLNRDGRLTPPAHDLAFLLARAEDWHRRTAGAFDIRVQPLWLHRARAAGGPPPLPAGRVAVAPGEITLAPGMALTLNGIAQGTIADRVATLLRARGFAPPLVDTGEMRLGASRPVRIAGGALSLRLGDCALATSAPDTLRFGTGHGHHLFDPTTGLSPDHWASVTVIAPDAETADALSTAFAVSDRTRIGDLAPAGVTVIACARDGTLHHFGTPPPIA